MKLDVRTRRIAVAFLAVLLIAALPVFAQNNQGFDPLSFDVTKELSNLPQIPTNLTTDFVLEQAVNPDQYVVGPGDLLLIGIWGNLPITFTQPVLADGGIAIPKVGVFNVQGQTLTACQELLAEKVAKYYKFDDFTVNLAQPRQFRVLVLGEVVQPGGYTVTSVNRLDYLLELAGNISSSGSWQRVTIQHIDGSETTVSLLDFFLRGDFDQNPFLGDGDRVIVHQADNAITMRGAINLGTPQRVIDRPQTRNPAQVRIPSSVKKVMAYELNEATTLVELFDHFRGFGVDADLMHVAYESGSTKEIVDLTQPETIPDISLKPGDIITIPETENVVYVTGAVIYPGPYPYVPNLTVQDYVSMAGGVDPRYGQTDGWKLINLSGKKQETSKQAIPQRGESIEVGRRFSVTLQEYLSPVIGIASVVVSAIALSTR